LGPVFRAYDPDRDRLVAVKLFRLDLPPERVHQLVAELDRLIGAGLSRHGIVAPLAAGIVDVSAFLAQEFVTADSLDIVLRDYGPATPPEAIRRLDTLASALDRAVGVGVSHGALHPRDVLVTAEDLRLTGLGVAQALRAVGVAAPVRLPYCAPERVANRDWDRRADVFGLAAVAGELLWGRRVVGTGAQAVEAFTPLPGIELSGVREVFEVALADDPGDRFATAREFVSALDDALAGRKRRPTEPRLPLDEPEVLMAPPTAEPVLAAVMPEASPAPEEPRLARGEFWQADEPSRPAEEPTMLDVQPQEAPVETVLDRSSSAIWPLAATLTLGLAIGFTAGYLIGNRDRQSVPSPAATNVTAPASGREFTEGAVTEPSKPASAQAAPPAATAPAAATRAPADPARAPTRATPAAASPAAPLSIESRPPGARVYLDGKFVGSTPANLPLVTSGDHTVRIERDGYRRWTSQIHVTTGERNRVTASLER